jgi:RNA polymerase sigma-70 factor (ECF subfamily)
MSLAMSKVRNPWAQELERIFEKHYQLVYRTAYSLTGNVQDSEDVLQTIFLRLLASEFPPDLAKDPEPYLYRAAFNLSMNVIRRRKRHVLTDNVQPFDKRHIENRSPSDDQGLESRLHEAIAELHPAAAQVVILRYVHNKSLTEIAKVMGTTQSTIAVSLFRSRARLKRLLRLPRKERP